MLSLLLDVFLMFTGSWTIAHGNYGLGTWLICCALYPWERRHEN